MRSWPCLPFSLSQQKPSGQPLTTPPPEASSKGSAGQNQEDEGLRVKMQPREGSRDHGYLGSQAGDLGQRQASHPSPPLAVLPASAPRKERS